MRIPALRRCAGDVDTFLGRYWGRAPLLRRADDPGAFDDLASLDDLDHMVSSLGLRSSSLRMVRDGKPLPTTAYTTPPGSGTRAREDVVNPALVYEGFAAGATIVLEGVHRYWQSLADFCRELEIALGHRLQVNAYVTPPGARGFSVHRDDHDVFVLQVSGRKHWLVYDRGDEQRVLIDEDLEAGSALYIPQGFPHAASAGESASAHLTVGILTHEGADVLREVLKLAEEESTFAERLPVGSTRDPDALREVVEMHVKGLRAWLDEVELEDVTHRVARRLATTSQPILRGQLRQLERLGEVSGDTTVARRAGASCLVFRGGDVAKVLLADRELEMPIGAADAVEEIAHRDRFQVRELYPYLDAQSAVVLVRRLVREGLLEVVVDE